MEETPNLNTKNERGILLNGSHDSLEIENHQDKNKESEDFSIEHMSVSLMDASNNLYAYNRADENRILVPNTDGYLQGAFLMSLTTLFWCIYHIVIKYVYTMNPGVGCFDTIMFMGLCLTPAYYLSGRYLGNDLNFFNYELKVKIVVTLRMIFGVISNIFFLIGTFYISIGKVVLIFSLNPLFCAIAAGLFLKEHISLLSIVLILCSVFGVYLFTLNKQENSTEENMEFIGYASVLISACLYGCNFVINKYLILYNVPTIVSPFYFGIGCLIQSLFLAIFAPSSIHFEEYDFSTIIGFCVVSMAILLGQLTWIYSTKFSAASKMAPIGYLENIFTLLSDAILFNYIFIFTDVLGILIIAVCLFIPIISKYIGSNK